jgi:hypothetical protein
LNGKLYEYNHKKSSTIRENHMSFFHQHKTSPPVTTTKKPRHNERDRQLDALLDKIDGSYELHAILCRLEQVRISQRAYTQALDGLLQETAEGAELSKVYNAFLRSGGVTVAEFEQFLEIYLSHRTPPRRVRLHGHVRLVRTRKRRTRNEAA